MKGVVSNKDLKKYRSKSNHFTFETKPLEKYSAIARRYYQIVRADYSNKEVDEPKKPNLEIKWPEDLSRTNPDIFNDNLPLTLSKILQNLDVMRVATESQGAEFVPMTFVWLPSHGMKLKLPEQTSIYIYLNHSMWPIKYGLIRELADFQNTVFKKYAEHYHLNLIDVDAYMPRDSLLFSDAIHNTKEGVRVRAWVVFQQVVQILDKNRQKKPVILKSTRPLNNLESNIKCYSQEDILAQCLDRHDNSFKNQ